MIINQKNGLIGNGNWMTSRDVHNFNHQSMLVLLWPVFPRALAPYSPQPAPARHTLHASVLSSPYLPYKKLLFLYFPTDPTTEYILVEWMTREDDAKPRKMHPMFGLVAKYAHLVNCHLQTLSLTVYLDGIFWVKSCVPRASNKSVLISQVCGVCFFKQHLKF